jgi:hypothetical protein
MRRWETRQSSRKRVLLMSMHSRMRASTHGALCDAKWHLRNNLRIPPPRLFRRASMNMSLDIPSFQVASKTETAQWRSIIQACARRQTVRAESPCGCHSVTKLGLKDCKGKTSPKRILNSKVGSSDLLGGHHRNSYTDSKISKAPGRHGRELDRRSSYALWHHRAADDRRYPRLRIRDRFSTLRLKASGLSRRSK